MQLSNDRFKNLRGKLALAGAVCFFLGVVAYWFTDGFAFLSAPDPTPRPKPAVARTAPSTPAAAPVSVAVQNDGKTSSEANAGNLGTFAAKQAELEVTKLEVAIAEQQVKLRELREGKPAPQLMQPQIVQQPVLPPLPPLSAPLPVGAPGELPSLPASSLAPRRSGLVAIQGVDGNLTAVFATANGRKTVRVGDAVMGGKVRSISLDSVTLASGKTISIED